MEQREALSEHVVSAVSGVSRHHTMLWAKRPFQWRFNVSVETVVDNPEKVHLALQAALMEWMNEEDQGALSMPEKPTSGSIGTATIFPFEMRHDHPTESLVNLRFDAISLQCLNKDTGLCHNGKTLFREVLARHCESCGDLGDLQVVLITPAKLKFAVSLAPMPQSLVDDVGRFQQITMEEWATRVEPLFQSIVAQTTDVAENLIKVRGAHIQNQPPKDGEPPSIGLVFEVELGLLAPTSKTPVRELMLAKMPWDHEWIVDSLGIASEEEHVGDIVVSVAEITKKNRIIESVQQMGTVSEHDEMSGL